MKGSQSFPKRFQGSFRIGRVDYLPRICSGLVSAAYIGTIQFFNRGSQELGLGRTY